MFACMDWTAGSNKLQEQEDKFSQRTSVWPRLSGLTNTGHIAGGRVSGSVSGHSAPAWTPCRGWAPATGWWSGPPTAVTGWAAPSWRGTSSPSQSTPGLMCPTSSSISRWATEGRGPSTTVPGTPGQCSQVRSERGVSEVIVTLQDLSTEVSGELSTVAVSTETRARAVPAVTTCLPSPRSRA